MLARIWGVFGQFSSELQDLEVILPNCLHLENATGPQAYASGPEHVLKRLQRCGLPLMVAVHGSSQAAKV
eukprot:12402014-Karenia_brevis.AAC.1